MKSIKDGLPPEGQEVLVKLKNGHYAVAVWTDCGCYYDWEIGKGASVEGDGESYACLSSNVISWSELPNE